MPTNFLESRIDETYTQLLHVDGGPTATLKTVYSGGGVATGLQVSTVSIKVGSITLQGNEITVDSGSLFLIAPEGSSVVAQDVSFTGGYVMQVQLSDSTATGLTVTDSKISASKFQLESFTFAQLSDVTSTANALGNDKAEGVMVWDSTNRRVKIATGGVPNSAWVDTDGSNSIIPT
jgi:hypothetical protein